MVMGRRLGPNDTIDRRSNMQGYTWSNIRWADKTGQRQNTGTAHQHTLDHALSMRPMVPRKHHKKSTSPRLGRNGGGGAPILRHHNDNGYIRRRIAHILKQHTSTNTRRNAIGTLVSIASPNIRTTGKDITSRYITKDFH